MLLLVCYTFSFYSSTCMYWYYSYLSYFSIINLNRIWPKRNITHLIILKYLIFLHLKFNKKIINYIFCIINNISGFSHSTDAPHLITSVSCYLSPWTLLWVTLAIKLEFIIPCADEILHHVLFICTLILRNKSIILLTIRS